MFKQKITTYIAAIFILALLLVTIYRIQQENSVNLDTPDDYFSSEKTAEQQSIDNNYPKLAVLKSIPYFTENNYFSYRVTSSFINVNELDVYLTPKFSEQQLLNQYYNQTKQEIFGWIIGKGTIISDLKINFYLENSDQSVKTLIETINQ